ncbi:MAG: transglutaminase family protein [Hyphomonadaceae bacterium]|nr:transglutaminase family protein [Hyphomonadaceae bacterium]
MRLQVRHVTRYDYTPPVARAGLRLKLFPSKFAGQKALNWSVTVNDAPVTPLFNGPYGDAEALWTTTAPSPSIEIVAEGVIDVEDTHGVVRGLAEPARPGLFLRTTPLTARSAGIDALATGINTPNVLDAMHQLCNAVRDAVDYEQSATHHQTTAAEALKLGRGVCQDHAHIFISAARSRGVPARYVTGYLMADGGEETHAWAEVCVPDLGWVAFDPSNRRCPTDSYVRLCAGLDAADAAPLRGSVAPHESERLAVEVDIAEASQQ